MKHHELHKQAMAECDLAHECKKKDLPRLRTMHLKRALDLESQAAEYCPETYWAGVLYNSAANIATELGLLDERAMLASRASHADNLGEIE